MHSLQYMLQKKQTLGWFIRLFPRYSTNQFETLYRHHASINFDFPLPTCIYNDQQ